MSNKESSIGKRVFILRNNIGLSVTDCAKMANINRSYLSDVENGTKKPSRNLLQALYNTFGVSFNWLLTGEGEMFVSSEKMEKDSPPIPELILKSVIKQSL